LYLYTIKLDHGQDIHLHNQVVHKLNILIKFAMCIALASLTPVKSHLSSC